MNRYHPEAVLIISIVSLLGFMFTAPICFIQITNAIKHTTTHERFAFGRRRPGNKMTTTSMPSLTLISTNGEIDPGEFAASGSFLVKGKIRKCC